jgi:hypothetical protein
MYAWPKGKDYMLAFIDESGDPGFRVSKGSSAIFVTSMVMFPDSASALSTQRKIEALQKKLGSTDSLKMLAGFIFVVGNGTCNVGHCPKSSIR